MGPEGLSEADFRTLGLEPGSKPSEVKQAYRALVKKWHPDRHHSKPYESRALAEKKFREIDKAYRRISACWEQTRKPARRRSSTAAPGTDPSNVQRPVTKDYVAPAVKIRPRIDLQILSRQKFMLPAFLMLLAAFLICAQLRDSSQSPVVGQNSIQSPMVGGQEKPQDGLQSSVVGGQEKPLPGELTQPTVASIDSHPVLPQSQAPESNSFFTLGSTSSEVLSIQGPPSRIQGQTWIYGLSEVAFRNGRVCGFNNFGNSLRVRMQPDGPQDGSPADHITIGSSEEEVLLVQGTPTRVEGHRWFYGFAELAFKNGRVAEYDNYFATLKIHLLPSALSDPEPPGNFFTIGSTPDEVLAAQGTPTSIHGNRWAFDSALVIFRDGRVRSVTNSDGIRFIPPEKADHSEAKRK